MANRFLNNIRINDAYTFPASDGNDGQVITTDGAGNLGFENISPDAASVIYRDNFTGDGSTVAFDLQNSITDEDQTQIYIDGVYQEKSTYSISGTTITFTTAPILGHSVEVISISSINTGPTVLYQDNFTGNGSDTAFTLGQAIDNEIKTFIFLNGVYQFKNTYTVDGTTLTFDAAPANGVAIEIVSIASAVQSDSLEAGAVIIPVKNTHTASIAKGTPVYISGNVGASERLQIAPADASNSAKMPSAGLLLTTLAVNAEGYAITGGYLRNITTDTIDGTSTASNDTVYVKAGGGLTMTKPTGTNLIQNIAKVARSASGSSGSLLVSSILRTNDIPNIANDHFWLGNSSSVATATSFPTEVGNYLTTNSYATESYVDTEVAGLVASAPTTLDTLNELAAALGDDPNFATTTANSIGLKAPLASPSFTGNATFGGNVGIGTGNTIYADLEVKRAGEVTLALHNSSAITSGNRGNLAFYNSNVSTVATIRAAADTDNVGTALEFYTRPVGGSLTNSMTIDSSGNVGIGDTSPQGKLEVNNRNTATGAALFIKGGEDDLSPIAGQYTGLAFGYGGGDIYNNAAILWEFTNTAANGKLHFAVNPTAGDGTANLSDSKMTILDSGKVGIGTQSPSSEVSGSAAVLEINDSINNNLASLALKAGTQGSKFEITASASDFLGFWDDGTERMRIDSSGNVGIKNTSPSDFLSWQQQLVVGNGSADAGITIYHGSGGGNQGAIVFADGNTGTDRYRGSISYNGADEMKFFTSTLQRTRIDSGGSIIIGDGTTSGTPTADYRSLEIGRQGNTITGAPWKSNLYFSTNATVTAGSTAFTYRYASVPASKLILENGEFAFQNAGSGSVGGVISFTERMRIDSSGRMLVGTTTRPGNYDAHYFVRDSNDSYAFIIQNTASDADSNSALQVNLLNTDSTTNSYMIIGRQGGVGTGTNRFVIYANGNMVNTNNSYGSISDERKKENIVDATPKLDDLMKVKVRNFNLKGEETKQIGVVAQELEEVFPGMVNESKDPDSEDETLYKGVKYSVFVPILIKAIQELKADNDSLRARIETLENN